MAKTFEQLCEDAKAATRRTLIRVLSRKLRGEGWETSSTSGEQTLIVIGDPKKGATVEEAIKAIESLDGVKDKMKKGSLVDGYIVKYHGGIISVVESNGKIRVEYS